MSENGTKQIKTKAISTCEKVCKKFEFKIKIYLEKAHHVKIFLQINY